MFGLDYIWIISKYNNINFFDNCMYAICVDQFYNTMAILGTLRKLFIHL